MDLFSLMGMDIPDVKPEEPAKKQKKEEKKEKQYPAGMIPTGFGDFHYPAGTFAEIRDTYQNEFPGILVLKEQKDGFRLYRSSGSTEPETKVKAGTLIAFGTYQCTTDEEGTVREALEEFARQYPEFSGANAKLCGEVLAPYMEVGKDNPKITFPAVVGYGSETITIEQVPDDPDYQKVLIQAYEKAYRVKLSGLHYYEDGNKWLPVYQTESGQSSSSKSGKTTSAAKAATTYKLPLSIYTPHETLNVTEEDFNGKTEITAEEARVFLEKQYFEYSRERTVMDYDKNRNTFVAILKSSTKGAVKVLPNGYFIIRDGALKEFHTTLP